MSNIFYIPTAIVVGLIGSYIGTIRCHRLLKNLSDQQPILYQDIRQRRLYYFITGVMVAIITATIYLCLSPSILYHRIVNALVILLLTPMVVYMLVPKSIYMLQQKGITTQETRDWFAIYVCMKNGTMYGFCIGFLTALLVLTLCSI
jgi:hypothetical protein